MLTEKTWEEFREIGLLWWINTMLHMFGWALCYEFNGEGNVERVYPARTKFRGFDGKAVDAGYKKVTRYLKENIDELLEEASE